MPMTLAVPLRLARCAGSPSNRPHTTAFEQDLLKRLIHSTVADIVLLTDNYTSGHFINHNALINKN